MKREFLQSFKVAEQPLSKEIIDAIMAENGKDIQQARQTGLDWEEKYNQAVEEHRQVISRLQTQSALEAAVSRAGGRNLKAISALLDMDVICQKEDLPAALDEALSQLKQEHDYLFEANHTPPPYAWGTGAREGAPVTHPATLAGALREKYERK